MCCREPTIYEKFQRDLSTSACTVFNIFISSAEVYDEATDRSTVYRSKELFHAYSVPALESTTTSTTHHSGNIYPSPHEDFEPVPKKARLDIDTELDGDCTHSSLSERFALEQKKPQVGIGMKLDDDSNSNSPSEGFEPVQKKPRLDIDTMPGDGNTSLLPSERSQHPPFGCGCGKCTFFSFIERGCPTPIPSASSFPYLNVSGLTNEQQQELKGTLRSESQKIMIRFQKLVSATIKSFERRCIPLDELVSHFMTLGPFDPVFKEPQVSLFQYCFHKLEAADTIPKVFLVLKDYFSFFNYHIIEHIIEELGTQEDKAELQKYKEDFNQYAKRRIFESLPQFGPVSNTDHADIFVKVDSQYENYTVAEIVRFRQKLSEILRVSSKGILRLCRVDKGCFQLMLQVPLFLQREIFPLSREQEMALEEERVIKLTCGEYQFLVKLPVFFLINVTVVLINISVLGCGIMLKVVLCVMTVS